MARISGSRLFTVWFWFGVPLVAGALVIAFVTNLWLGLLTLGLVLGWAWHLADTACSRCASYGTTRWGVQGLVIPLIWKKKSAAGAPAWRVRLQYYLDLACLVYLNAIYALFLPLLPVALVWTVGAWFIVFGPKKYHALLFQLRTQPAEERKGVLSLPVVQAPSAEGTPEQGGPPGFVDDVVKAVSPPSAGAR